MAPNFDCVHQYEEWPNGRYHCKFCGLRWTPQTIETINTTVMAKEEKTLSEQDKQRIEQEANRLWELWNEDGETVFGALMKIAEYEHKYQREQHKEEMAAIKARAVWDIGKLEAERTELRKLFSDIVFETEHDGGISLSTFKKIKSLHNIDPKLS